MNNKKKQKKTSADKKRSKKTSSLRFGNKTGGIRVPFRRRTILLPLAGALVIALIFWGVNAYFNPSKGNNTAQDSVTKGETVSDTSMISSPADTIKVKNLKVFEITDRSLTVTWKTDIPSSSEVSAYAQESGFSVAGWPDNELVTEHKFILEDLEPATIYLLTIKSKDTFGNQVIIEMNDPYQTLSTRLTTEITIGQTSPDFTLPSLEGKSVSLRDFRGKCVLLLFWKASCSSCRQELPHVNEFWTDIAHDDCTVLTINVKEKETIVTNYIRGQDFSFPVLLDAEGETANKFTVTTYPTSFLVDAKGIIIKVKEASFKNKEEIEEFISTGAIDNQ